MEAFLHLFFVILFHSSTTKVVRNSFWHTKKVFRGLATILNKLLIPQNKQTFFWCKSIFSFGIWLHKSCKYLNYITEVQVYKWKWKYTFYWKSSAWVCFFSLYSILCVSAHSTEQGAAEGWEDYRECMGSDLSILVNSWQDLIWRIPHLNQHTTGNKRFSSLWIA